MNDAEAFLQRGIEGKRALAGGLGRRAVRSVHARSSRSVVPSVVGERGT